MRRLALAFLLALLAATALACRGEGGDNLARTINVEDLTIDEVRQRALEALERPGEVFHSTQTVTVQSNESPFEVWVDLERDLARVHRPDGSRELYHDGLRAELSEGEFSEGPSDLPEWTDKLAASALDYLQLLFGGNLEGTELKEGEVDGVAAMLVETERAYTGESGGTEEHRLYLDESFLPLLWESQIELGDLGRVQAVTRFENEFVPQDSLAADFFSPDSLRAEVITPSNRLAEAIQAGLAPYWLGERYEEMVVADARLGDEGEAPVLHLDYENEPAEPGRDPLFGVSITEYTPEGWAGGQAAEWQERPGLIETQVQVLGTTATLHEDPNANRPGVDVTPPPDEPTASPTELAEPRESGWLLLVELGDAVILIEPNIGPPGNPYRNAEALVALANALVLFQP